MSTIHWQPGATIEILQLRARLRQRIRAFFDARDVLEVETPVLSSAGTTDVYIDSLTTRAGDPDDTRLYLQTSPEFAMKRLLAAGSGAIYQLARVFRYAEQGNQHHPEFTMLEWYRPDFDHRQLMHEVDALVRTLLADSLPLKSTLEWSYQQAWLQTIGIDPFTIELEQLRAFASQQGIDTIGDLQDMDAWLQLIMSYCVEPALPSDTPVFIYDYPSTQAALARIRPGTPPVAERFELYINGMELANGFHELSDAVEQRQRFVRDNQLRRLLGKAEIPLDENLLAALAELPDCAGVALGFDRIMMLASGTNDIREVLSFASVESK